MTLHTVTDPDQPGQPPSTHINETPVSCVLKIVGKLLADSALAREQFQEARHDQARADQFDAGAEQASRAAADAQARAIAERHKASPHKRVNRHLGTGLAICLAILDALPAYWSAEAFGFDRASTVVLTVLLCSALGGAMWLLDLFVDKQRRLATRILGCALGAGFVGMFVLRLDYLQVSGGSGIGSAAIQALALTSISAALVGVGFVLLSHRLPIAVASAESTARKAARLHDKQVVADLHAKAAMSRAALADTIVTWVLAHEPAGIGHEQLLRATNEAIGVLLTQQQ
jgi:hypothetical protein